MNIQPNNEIILNALYCYLDEQRAIKVANNEDTWDYSPTARQLYQEATVKEREIKTQIFYFSQQELSL